MLTTHWGKCLDGGGTQGRALKLCFYPVEGNEQDKYLDRIIPADVWGMICLHRPPDLSIPTFLFGNLKSDLATN